MQKESPTKQIINRLIETMFDIIIHINSTSWHYDVAAIS